MNEVGFEATYGSHIGLPPAAAVECLAISKFTPPQVADLERLLAAANQRCVALEARLGLLERELVEAEGGEVRTCCRGWWCCVLLQQERQNLFSFCTQSEPPCRKRAGIRFFSCWPGGCAVSWFPL